MFLILFNYNISLNRIFILFILLFTVLNAFSFSLFKRFKMSVKMRSEREKRETLLEEVGKNLCLRDFPQIKHESF